MNISQKEQLSAIKANITDLNKQKNEIEKNIAKDTLKDLINKYGVEKITNWLTQIEKDNMTEKNIYLDLEKPTMADFHRACRAGNLMLVKLMILNGSDYWNSGLQTACFGGHLELAKLMISNGADNHEEVFETVCSMDNLELVKFITECGVVDKLHQGFYQACLRNRQEVMKYLISRGVSYCQNCDRSVSAHLE